MIAFAGTELPPSAARRINEAGVAGVTLFHAHNIVDPPQIRRLTAAIQEARPAGAPPVLVAADQEGGQLIALGDGTTQFAGAMALGATGDEELAERVAGATARELRALGVNVDYAPVCDVADDPANPALGIRSFGDDPEAVGRLAAATVRGLQGEGVAATAKHFPGAGDTAADPHHELPLVPRTNAELAERELVPFRAALDAGARMVMTGHFALPGQLDLPTSLSAAVLRDLLRGQLHFDGVTVTDALDMRALAQGSAQIVDAVAALRAGEDVLLGTPDEAALQRLEEGIAQAQRRGLIDADDDAAANRRLAELRDWLGRYDQPSLDVVGCAEHQALAAELARRSLTLVRNDDRLLPLTPGADARIAVVQSMPADLTPADTSSTVPPTLASALRRRLPGVEEILLPAAPGRGRHRRSRRAACSLRRRRRRDVLGAPPAGAGGPGRGGPGVRQADRDRRPAHAVGPARLPVRPNPCLQLRHPAAVDGGAGGRAAWRGAVRRPVARRHRRPASTRSRTHWHGAEGRDPGAAGRRPAAARLCAGGVRPDLRRGPVAPAAVRRHRRPRHLGQRRHLRAVPAGHPKRLGRRPGGAVDDHALRGAPGHGRRAGRRHLAVGPLTGHRRGGRGGAAAGRPDRRADQRRRFRPGRHGRPRGRPARRTGAGDGRDQDLHDRAARGGAAVDGTRPALVREKRSTWPACLP